MSNNEIPGRSPEEGKRARGLIHHSRSLEAPKPPYISLKVLMLNKEIRACPFLSCVFPLAVNEMHIKNILRGRDKLVQNQVENMHHERNLPFD